MVRMVRNILFQNVMFQMLVTYPLSMFLSFFFKQAFPAMIVKWIEYTLRKSY